MKRHIFLLCVVAAVCVFTFAAVSTSSVHAAEAKIGFDIGNLAPEIEGEDIDGVKFKLSDYRGKVVVLDFWGDW